MNCSGAAVASVLTVCSDVFGLGGGFPDANKRGMAALHSSGTPSKVPDSMLCTYEQGFPHIAKTAIHGIRKISNEKEMIKLLRMSKLLIFLRFGNVVGKATNLLLEQLKTERFSRIEISRGSSLRKLWSISSSIRFSFKITSGK